MNQNLYVLLAATWAVSYATAAAISGFREFLECSLGIDTHAHVLPPEMGSHIARQNRTRPSSSAHESEFEYLFKLVTRHLLGVSVASSNALIHSMQTSECLERYVVKRSHAHKA